MKRALWGSAIILSFGALVLGFRLVGPVIDGGAKSLRSLTNAGRRADICGLPRLLTLPKRWWHRSEPRSSHAWAAGNG